MAKQGEVDYLEKLGDEGQRHAAGKPFSDIHCGMYLMDLGTILQHLPPPPARVLDLGVGTGWTSVFLAKTGYEVVGVDIAPMMIELAEANRTSYGAEGLRFVVSDYESLPFREEFDCAIFYDSLHHAVDEEGALAGAYRALKPGGSLICHEPGEGHALVASSIKARELYGVTEKDMPPRRIVEVGERVGFGSHELFRHCVRPERLGPVVGWKAWLALYCRRLAALWGTREEYQKAYRRRNIVVLRK